MIIQYDPDPPVLRIMAISKGQEFDELSAPVTFPYETQEVSVVQVDTGQKRECAVSFVFMISLP